MTLTWDKYNIILPDGKHLIVSEKAVACIAYDDDSDDGDELYTEYVIVMRAFVTLL